MLADWAAIAIENARLYETSRAAPRRARARRARAARRRRAIAARRRRRDRPRPHPGADRQARARARRGARRARSLLRDGDELRDRRRARARSERRRRRGGSPSTGRPPARCCRTPARRSASPTSTRDLRSTPPSSASPTPRPRCSSRCVFRGTALGVLAAFDRARRRPGLRRRGRAAAAGLRRAARRRPWRRRRSVEAASGCARRSRRPRPSAAAGRASCTTRRCRSSAA